MLILYCRGNHFYWVCSTVVQTEFSVFCVVIFRVYRSKVSNSNTLGVGRKQTNADRLLLAGTCFLTLNQMYSPVQMYKEECILSECVGVRQDENANLE